MFIRSFPDRKGYEKLASEHNVVAVCSEILADMDTPVSLLRKFFCPGRDCFLFESMEGTARWGRYSFLGLSSRARVLVYRDRVEIHNGVQREVIPHGGDPLAVLREFMSRFKVALSPELPRFQGGMVGYFTYETVSFFENIPNRLDENAVMAEFMMPDEMIIFDNVRHTLMCVVLTFIGKGDDISLCYDNAVQRLTKMTDDIQRPFRAIEVRRQRDLNLRPVEPDDVYRKNVAKTKEMIFDGEIIQAVIAQSFEADAPGDPTALYRAMRFINPSPYLYFMHFGGMTICGASPETMVRLEGTRACVRPIAGTRPRGCDETQDRILADELLKDEKEKAEHLMLVDLGRNDLGKVAVTGTVQVTDLMFIERYSHVMHLVSNVECDMREGLDCFDLFRATFPAGTLSGAPKVRAMEIIAGLEKTPRGPYGGAVGYIAFGGNMDFAITIRTAVIEGEKLTVHAGAGIVADSDPETERMETVNKARAIERALHFIGDRC
ncbi:MAG TPA: chorismate-binding protein [Phycisphaerae bacterium]|nr:chorismate-binding protein [Phycisphaerae bacterium]HPS52238.1 chorismate-binding protein [Phycisphaerae bacterium]